MTNQPDSPHNEQVVKLTDITRGLYHAASSTYAMMANQYIDLLSQYFDKTTDGSYQPKTVVIQLPDESTVNLPLISLVTPKGLMLDKVNFDFSIAMESEALSQATTALDGLDLTRSSLKVELAPKSRREDGEGHRDSGIVDVSMEFQVNEPPEGIMRLLDKFTSFVTPVKSKALQAKPAPHLSPRFFFIAQVLRDKENEKLASTISHFNPEYSLENIQEKGNLMKQWEDELLQKSIDIDQAKADLADDFEKIFLYARIAFKDKSHVEKLNLSQKLSNQVREWTNQAMQFYETLLREDELALIFSRFKNPAMKVEDFKTEWQEGLEKIEKVKQLLEEYDEHKNKPEYVEAQDWLQKFTAVMKILLKETPEHLAILFPDTEFFNK